MDHLDLLQRITGICFVLGQVHGPGQMVIDDICLLKKDHHSKSADDTR